MLLKLYLALVVINQFSTVKCKKNWPFSPLSFTLWVPSMYCVFTHCFYLDLCVLKLCLLFSNPIQAIIAIKYVLKSMHVCRNDFNSWVCSLVSLNNPLTVGGPNTPFRNCRALNSVDTGEHSPLWFSSCETLGRSLAFSVLYSDIKWG